VTVLCLGEAIVDLICEREVDSIAEADSFRPHVGGALANVAVATRRHGASAALAGGAGDDALGAWLRDRLEREDIDLRWFRLVPGLRTPLALATFDRDREPRFAIYGDGIEAAVRSLSDRLDGALAEASALIFGSNTLVGDAERELTRRARSQALERGTPILFDPNLRAHRWDALDRARGLCREMCEGALVARANLDEARWMTGLDRASGPEAAAALCELGATLGIVTLGDQGASMRGVAQADVTAPAVDLVSALGAGDAFTGALVAGLATIEWDARRAAEALPAAVEAGSDACTTWGALT
jgi:fructokinase